MASWCWRQLGASAAAAFAVAGLAVAGFGQGPARPAERTSMTEIRSIIRARAAEVAKIDGEGLPHWSTDKKQADRVAGGELPFQGDIWVKVGTKDIDWSGGQYPHIEWVAALNRFRYLLPLASAYETTRDERYAQAARAYIEDWMRQYLPWDQRLERGDNTLNTCTRFSSWARVLPAFLDSPSFDDAFVQQMLDSLSVQGEELSHNFTSTNFRMNELNSLVILALRLPFLPNAQELLSVGVAGLRANLSAQFLPDGVHVERTPGYHDIMADMAVKYARMAKQFPEADPHVNLDTVRRALDYGVQSSLSAFNDCGIRYRDPEQLRGVEERVATLKELLPNEEITACPPLEQVFPNAGHVFLRSAWKPGADYLAFDAGTWGGGHCHLSRLSFTFRAGGRVLVADPGCPSYEMSDPLAVYLRSTPAHSTLNLNNGNQSESDAQLLRAEFTPTVSLLQARYQGGYWPGKFTWSFEEKHGAGTFGRHYRTLLWIKGEYLLALDAMEGDSGATVHNVWQMGPMEGWEKDEPQLSWWSRNADENLFLQLVPFGAKVQMACFEGSKDPLRGWVGKSQTETTAAPQVDFSYPVEWKRAGTAVLLVPFSGSARPVYPVVRAGTAGGRRGEVLYELELGRPDGGTDLIAWSATLETALEELPTTLTSDGGLVWLRRDAAGHPVKGFVLNGSFVQYQGRMLYESGARETKLFP